MRYNIDIDELSGWNTSISVVSENGKPLDLKDKVLYSNELITTKELTYEQFIKMCLKYSVVFSTTNGGLRRLSNFKRTNILTYDFDNGTTLEEATNGLECSWIAFASTNHMREKNGVTCPRFHLIIPLRSDIEDIEFFKYVSKSFSKTNGWDVDRVSSTPTQYFKKRRELLGMSKALLLDPSGFKGRFKMFQEHQKIMNELEAQNVKKMEGVSYEKKLEWVMKPDLVAGVNDKGQKHNCILILAGRMKKYGFSREEALTELRRIYNGSDRAWQGHTKTIDWVFTGVRG